MSEKKVRKRTRSEKGLAFDEMNAKSPKVKTIKLALKEKPKSKVSHRIIFNDEKEEESNKEKVADKLIKQKNNNSTVMGIKSKIHVKNNKVPNVAVGKKKKPLLHDCFKKVFRWDVKQGKINLQELKNSEPEIFEQIKESDPSLFQNPGMDTGDGINMNIEGLDDLDYVDDEIDGDFSDIEVETTSDNNLEQNTAFVDSGLSRVMVAAEVHQNRSTGNGVAPLRMTMMANNDNREQGTCTNPTPSTSNSIGKSTQNKTAAQLSDDELAALPRVKNLFNRFWDEKMREMEKGESYTRNKRRSVECIVNKSPSDTTIYAPALNKSPARGVVDQNMLMAMMDTGHNVRSPVTGINNVVSNFVDAVRFEHQQDLMAREQRRASGDVNAMSEAQEFERAKDKSKQAVVEAENFSANVAAPEHPGKESGSPVGILMHEPIQKQSTPNLFNQGDNAGQSSIPIVGNIANIGSGVSDDDFFHLTCHIDPNLIVYIK